MDAIAAANEWAEHAFGSAELGDRRRTRRLVESAAKIAALPEKPFTQVLDWNELRGWYRLCNESEATVAAVQGPHWEQTRQAMGQQALVLILHDTSEMDFTDHPTLIGTGPIGDGNGRGFLQHNSLAVLPKPRDVLGLAYQQWRLRRQAPKGEHSAKRKKRKRESELWLEGIRAIGRPPEGSCWVDVGDRGCDIYEAMAASWDMGHHFLFRLTQNRWVFTDAEQTHEDHILTFARSLPSHGSDTVDIPGRGGREARTATVQLAAAPVWIGAPVGTPRRRSQPIIAAWVIRVWEVHPPAGVKPLEWLLVCSLPTQALDELKERRDWYACRWMVEVFHDIEKNGCSEEGRRFQTADRMETCLAVLSVVAVRIFQMRCALDNHPDKPAAQVATQDEIQLVRRFLKHKGRRFTVRDFVRGVAKLGGFLGRKHDGEPGVRTLWRGYQRLQDMLMGVRLHECSTSS